MKHVLLRDATLNGWEYGMLRHFEDDIIRMTGAEVLNIPVEADFVRNKFGHGMRLGGYRRYLPKRELFIEADVVWCILMGPEDYKLDLFKTNLAKIKHSVLYLYDTLDPQLNLIQRLFSGTDFNIKITSFSEAVVRLNQLTGQSWRVVEQAVPDELFQPVGFDKRVIGFSSYGRKLPDFHEVLKEFCYSNGIYFDYTTHDARHPVVDARELYRQYAWHMQHSLFTVSWPLEMTNQIRAGNQRPITCRWFEAASCGTTIVGQVPGNKEYSKVLDPMLVTCFDPTAPKGDQFKALERIWQNREERFQLTQEISSKRRHEWTWSNRIDRILNWIDKRDL